MATAEERILELEKRLVMASAEVANSHIIIAALTSRANGGVVLHDQELQNIASNARLTIHRDEQVPGCVILVKAKIAEQPHADGQHQPVN